MGLEIHLALTSRGADQLCQFIQARYDVYARDLNDYLPRVRYMNPETQEIVLENVWDEPRQTYRWIILDPAVELYLLANLPEGATLVRTP